MRPSPRFISVLIALLFLAGFATRSFGQKPVPDLKATRGLGGYVDVPPIEVNSPAAAQPAGNAMQLVFPADAATSRENFSASFDANAARIGAPTGTQGNDGAASLSHRAGELTGVMTGLDTVPTFYGSFAAQAGPSLGTVFPFVIVGNDPHIGHTTRIPTKITAISLNLLNADGTLRVNVPFAPFEDLTEDSPNFAESNYTSGHHIQYQDAVQRAQFFNQMGEDWHTVLGQPKFVNRVTFTIPRF